jgi:hypothetical protein
MDYPFLECSDDCQTVKRFLHCWVSPICFIIAKSEQHILEEQGESRTYQLATAC